ncbi:MAG: hypothetical protein RLZZ436_122 [Planctomycetota bacterium]
MIGTCCIGNLTGKPHGRARAALLHFLLGFVSCTLALLPAANAQNPSNADFPSLDQQPLSDRLPGRRNTPPDPPNSGSALPPADELDRPPLDDRVRPPLPELPLEAPDDQTVPGINDFGIDWRVQRISAADLGAAASWAFEHGQPSMTDVELGAYGEFIRAAVNRRNLIPASLPEGVNPTTAWETAFYQFESVRRQAFRSGVLRLDLVGPGAPDPLTGSGVFEGSGPPGRAPVTTPTVYSLHQDMRAHPADFVGRPVVLYGIFTPSGPLDVTAAGGLEDEDSRFRMQRGTLKNLTGREPLAIIDALQFVEPGGRSEPSSAWPVERGVQMPVMIKGWFVKLWGRQPLIFTELVRVLSPQPYTASIREHVANRRRVGADESWLYYETLRQLQLTSGSLQQQLALATQQRRVDRLLSEVRQKAAADRLELDARLKRGTLPRADTENRAGYDTQLRRLERQLALRESRYAAARRDPTVFPVFVDLFQNPDVWQGELVTLRGYVRRVLTHPGDPSLFNGQPLHELWLYTADSQHIPTVVVTPSLPRDFPLTADLVDSVTVTGCFYRMYVYRGQSETRQAPLVLAGRIDWRPSPQHVLNLVREGRIPADAPIVASARANDPRRLSDTVVLGLGVLAVVIAMAVFGRVQRDRRRRERLRKLVEESPDFRQTPAVSHDAPRSPL